MNLTECDSEEGERDFNNINLNTMNEIEDNTNFRNQSEFNSSPTNLKQKRLQQKRKQKENDKRKNVSKTPN